MIENLICLLSRKPEITVPILLYLINLVLGLILYQGRGARRKFFWSDLPKTGKEFSLLAYGLLLVAGFDNNSQLNQLQESSAIGIFLAGLFTIFFIISLWFSFNFESWSRRRRRTERRRDLLLKPIKLTLNFVGSQAFGMIGVLIVIPYL